MHTAISKYYFTEGYLRPIKERLEDIEGETRASQLIRMEHLDTANLFRLDEHMERVGTSRGREGTLRGILSDAGTSVQRAQSQVDVMRALDEESQKLRQMIRLLNRVFIQVMDGRLSPRSEEFRQVIATHAVLFIIMFDIFKPVFDIAMLYKHGEDRHQYLLEPKYGIHYYNTINEEPFESGGVIIGYPVPMAAAKTALAKRLEEIERSDIEQITHNILAHCLDGFRKTVVFSELHRVFYNERWEELCANINGFVRPLYDLKQVCLVLEKPENHVRVRSNQQVLRSVPSRTVADMVNEMAGELTNLPRYTAYAKRIGEADGKQAIWKGRIETLQVTYRPGVLNPGLIDARRCKQYYIAATTRPYLKDRASIEEVMLYRQECWREEQTDEPRIIETGGKQAEATTELGHPAGDEPPPQSSRG
jgi:hypothetical protein